MTADRPARTIAIGDVQNSLAVEASAGTGKTSTLIDRILHLTLERGPDGPPLSLREICAITFTEKAAGEMKIRLRHELEVRSRDRDIRGDRARRGLHELDAAAISTFHAFAVSLLKERPFEAGLDPRFTALDEVQGGLFLRECWDMWIQSAIEGRHPTLERALRAGMTLEGLRGLADTLRRRSGESRSLRLQPPLSDGETALEFARLREEGRALSLLALSTEDKLLSCLREALDWFENPDAPGDPVKKPGTKGAQRAWQGGKETVERVRRYVESVIDFRSMLETLPSQGVLDAVVRWLIQDFLPDWQERKRSRALADFDDQLRAARDLLRSCRAARAEFQERYRTVLVDEFQDTDPLQLEIVLLLTCTDLAEVEPGRLRPAPGRLFVVGDPKQSIYRFRGADIETYAEVTDPARSRSLGLRRVELTTNMRSVPSLLRFIDRAFTGLMRRPEDGLYQPDYLPFGGPGVRTGEPDPPSVHILGDRDECGTLAGSGSRFFRQESSRIAALISRMIGNRDWGVEERGPQPPGSAAPRRPPRYGDIAILLPVLTRSNELEEALRDLGIPYVLEGGKFYYARSEVASAVTVLRAVASPNDRVALYGALRSVFFGLSDEDLLRARLEGLSLDYRSAVPPGSPLAQAYELLLDLHLHRHQRSAAETLERLLQRTGAREVLATRGFQSLANLGKLTRTLRTLQQDSTFSEAVELISSMNEEDVEEGESRLMEERGDAVRVMSIHRSKGLDFPIVFVAGLGFRKQYRAAEFLADPHVLKTFAVKARVGRQTVRTPGWDDLAESDHRREEAELLRLLYVALTRARDHLVLCTHHKGRGGGSSGIWSGAPEGTRLGPLAELLRDETVVREHLASLIGPAMLEAQAAARGEEAGGPDAGWIARLRRERRELAELISGTPFARGRSAAGRLEESGPAGADRTFEARERALRLGSAFHEAMEGIDLRDAGTVAACVERAGARNELNSSEIIRLREIMRNCLSSSLLQEAMSAFLAGKRVWRELPLVRQSGTQAGVVTLEAGRIDLLFEGKRGWVLVDYKTDRIDALTPDCEQALRDKYGPQVREYADILSDLGVRLASAFLLLARSGEALRIV